ncbi:MULTISPECIES: DUF2231 domain-containing protein [unclassified Mycolicibacterium]|uniref:DUF2231 domain-containing protein n=1 Tax=unclassified Mycolicibacterium TaxID=2636767 RepID=UPI001306C435|nr:MULTISPECIES: DUF2231 domain-containing protein [unclassified Mycolicibacterium]MUL80959.1 hypothetical protein [Mycolicibacterium sp. CBMA 329]MUL86725.1 hypothetical protein [Mycolicibacterium sp. CBMA 331]MUL98989.1 hypothetical protein [Mycolicibacterium sp. CBMA 334]MUM28170.1 hypothetical protein [Mycolicibacterium sp. CBMA 295]MUM37022.1 hypothetical protein [Mycolicibacterium sp. CBMA 247]
MTVINGLPAHVLLVHAMVVLAPLTAVLAMVCALWPAARRGHLLWLTLILAVVTTVLTPITTGAGEWLYDLRPARDAVLQEHAERGDTMIYFSLALLVVALALVALRFAERRDDGRRVLYNAVVAVVAVLVGLASIVQIYRIGDLGARSVWGSEISNLTSAGDD